MATGSIGEPNIGSDLSLPSSHAGCRGFESHHPLQLEEAVATGDGEVAMARSDDVLSINEICAVYGITRQTFYTAMGDGARDATIQVGKYRFVDAKKFRAWVKEHRAFWLHPLFLETQGRRRAGMKAGMDKMRATRAALMETARKQAKKSV